mmetsp:Transcript_53207/g.106808  ORF Transcript_53207/g.106808 Transcript_53207/m.106808 type:complete len:208 (-) Transcript_53207:341-964(-)
MVALKAATWLIPLNVDQADTAHGFTLAGGRREEPINVRLVEHPRWGYPRPAGGIDVPLPDLLLPGLAVTPVAQDQDTDGAAHDGHSPEGGVLDDGVHSGLPLGFPVVGRKRLPTLLMGVPMLAVVVAHLEDTTFSCGEAHVELLQYHHVASPSEAVPARLVATAPQDEVLTLIREPTPRQQEVASTCTLPWWIQRPAAIQQEQRCAV